MISETEYKLVQDSMRMAVEAGAQGCRVTFSRNEENLISILDGSVDKITSCLDRALTFYVFTKGRYGSFSTNKTDYKSVRELVGRSIPMIQMLSEDEFRKLPDPGRCCKNARRGDELCLYDPEYRNQSGDDRIKRALSLGLKAVKDNDEYSIASEEGEYSDSIYESITVDTNGLDCRHCETSFDYWIEITIEDRNGRMHSGYSWTTSPFLKSFDGAVCSARALNKAISQTGSSAIRSGKYNMVVSNEVSAKFVSPLLNALNGYCLQQHNSFLEGSLDKQIFPEGLTITDMPHIKGEGGSKMFDEEGVATHNLDIIRNGVVKTYFLNTYMSGKLGMKATTEDSVRPFLEPWPDRNAGLDEILGICGSGIYVTEFNGGNFNTVSGDFSYGIEGFLFKDGKITEPVSGMLVTGNLLSLWSSFIASGADARRCCVKLVPTLAFKNVDFNGNNQ